MPNTVIYANMLPFIATLFLLLFVKINPLFDKKQNKLFFLSAATILFMLVTISIDYTVSLTAMQYGWVIRRITSFINFSFGSLIPIYLVLIFTNKKMKLLLYLPALINTLICFVSIFVNLVFFLPENGGYDRGPLFFVPSLVTLFYITYLLVASLRQRHKRAYEASFLIGVILGFVFAIYLEVMEHFKFLSWDFAAIFLILYYLLLNINKSKIDPLTGSHNRAMYVQDIGRINRSKRCLIAMIDINGFKKINDEKGHEEGDRLLIQFVELARFVTDKKVVLYRIGGDEFAVISELETMEQFQERISMFFAELQKHDIYCAVGFEEYEPSIDIEVAIHAADLKMYQDKRKFHSEQVK